MEKKQIEELFNKEKKKIEKLCEEIDKYIETYEDVSNRGKYGMTEADLIRLTRTVQEIRRNTPQRELIEENKNLIFKIIDGFRQRNIAKKESREQPQMPRFKQSYLIAQECLESLKKLKEYDKMLSEEYQEDFSDFFLNTSTNRKEKSAKREGTSILDDYRQQSWGVERVCLDGMQNHLPSDSGGTNCYLHFLVNDVWVDVETARLTPEKITKVRFSDDGVGFTYKNLLFLHSTKTSESGSVGQFGEGMKLASMASVNLGLGMEFQSRNWSAFAVGEKEEIVNTRDNDNTEKRTRLVYDITEYEGEPIKGSRTIFHTPTPEFIKYALELPEKILHLNPNYKPLFKSNFGDIVSTTKGGDIFVKGVFIKHINSFFSYNFDDAEVNPDRNNIINKNIYNAIDEIMQEVSDKEILRMLIANILEKNRNNTSKWNLRYNRDSYEAEMGSHWELLNKFKHQQGMPSLWKEAFEEVCNATEHENAKETPRTTILKTDYKVPEQLSSIIENYNVISISEEWTELFSRAGVQTDRDVLPESLTEEIETSFVVDYGHELLTPERILLESVQNHLPSDTGGYNTCIRFQTKDEIWHDYTEFPQFTDNSEIIKVKIADDGRGYDYKRLGLLSSGKDQQSSSAGKWGEGMKMLTVGALYAGMGVEFHSMDWRAIAKTKEVILNEGTADEKKVQRMYYEVTKKIDEESTIIEDGDTRKKINGRSIISSTTFTNPTSELIKEFRNIGEKVVYFSPLKPIVSKGEDQILSFHDGKIFIRGLLVPGDKPIKYSYSFSDFDIETRDRNAITIESLQTKITKILTCLGDKEDRYFIAQFLKDAIEFEKSRMNSSEKPVLEFMTKFMIQPNSKVADNWISVFHEVYGENTSIRCSSDPNMNAVHMAQHVGLDIVTLPDCIANALMNTRGTDGECIKSYISEVSKMDVQRINIPYEELSPHEQEIIKWLYNFNPLLATPNNSEPLKKITVYKYPDDYDGPRAAGMANKGDSISISRDTLNGNYMNLVHILFHETDHMITGAQDADSAFRDHLTRMLAKITLNNNLIPPPPELDESVEDGGVAKGITTSDVTRILGEMRLKDNTKEVGDK